jgi:MoaA/NifB/PqqE/SkfB family radical SAM enzyme
MKFPPSFFRAYINECPACRNNLLDSVLDISLKGISDCITCMQHYDKFVKFWGDFTNSSDDITMIARHSSAIEILRRVFFAYSYKGVHKPLILPGSMKIEITRRCNLSCKHCLANSSPEIYPELTLSEIIDLMSQAKKLGVTSIGLVGGEPFVRKDLPRIVDAAADIGMFYSVSTNGMLITHGNVKLIKSKFLRKVSVSLDGNREYHNHLRENNNAYDFAFRGIEIMKTEKIPVAIAMMINKENKHLIKAVIEDAISVGADFFVINDLIPTGRGWEIKENCLSYPEYMEVTEGMKEFRMQYGNRINILWKGMNPGGPVDKDLGNIFNSKCGAGLTELTINNDGFILPCPFLPATSENIRKKSLEEIWYQSEELASYQNRDHLTGGCGSCHKQYSCSGCRARALAHTGSIYGPDIRCPLCQ